LFADKVFRGMARIEETGAFEDFDWFDLDKAQNVVTAGGGPSQLWTDRPRKRHRRKFRCPIASALRCDQIHRKDEEGWPTMDRISRQGGG
jgi:hypothetical protein